MGLILWDHHLRLREKACKVPSLMINDFFSFFIRFNIYFVWKYNMNEYRILLII
jgi:hypothetical protein